MECYCWSVIANAGIGSGNLVKVPLTVREVAHTHEKLLLQPGALGVVLVQQQKRKKWLREFTRGERERVFPPTE